MKSKDFVKKALDICDTKTVYVQRAKGEFLNQANKLRLSGATPFNSTRSEKIFKVGEDVRAFDELGLVSYVSNKDFKDFGQLIGFCTDISKNFLDIKPGEIVFMQDRAGIYVGDGKVVTASLDGVGVTTVNGWKSHGKLRDLEFVEDEPAVEVAPEPEEEKTDVDKQESDVVVHNDSRRRRH